MELVLYTRKKMYIKDDKTRFQPQLSIHFMFLLYISFCKVFLLTEKLLADSCLQKFDVLKTNICLRSEASMANMLSLVLRMSNFQEATIRLIVPRQKQSISIVFIVPQ